MKQVPSYNQWLEIDKKKFLQNVSFLKELLGTDIAAVVKGNGYGHGMVEATQLFYEAGIRHFCTYHAHAALRMKRKFPDCRWIAMGPVRREELDQYFKEGIELFVWDADFIVVLSEAAAQTDHKAKVHLELETGMYRTGIAVELACQKIQEWVEIKSMDICGVCTHFSGADEEDNLGRIDRQLQAWKQAKATLTPFLKEDVLWHGESSSAAVYLKERAFTIARMGILMYGFFPSEWSRQIWPGIRNRPAPAIQLKARICGYNHLPEGKYTGYGAVYKADSETSTAIIPVGYADGFPRNLSHQWAVKSGHQQLHTLGRINMNMTVFQHMEQKKKEEEEIIVIDSTPPFDWYEASDKSGRFIYEILTCLPHSLPKVIK